MLSSISPLGERARATRWGLTVTAYVLGSLVGGAVLGGLAGAVGSALPDRWIASPVAAGVVVALLLLGLVLDLRSGEQGPPSWRRQVDEAWLARYRGWVYGLGFGVQLGLGVVTIVTSSTVYATVVLAALTGSVPGGALLGLVFGGVRALPVLALRRVQDRTELHRVFARLERLRGPADAVARGALVGAALAVPALVVAGGS
jgi:sulfite exporter TauE/SafE